jgi:ribose transport system ATP-binding protein
MHYSNTATPALLEMRGIQKHFVGVPALSDASLRIDAAEVHALMGQNGAGKSTLIKVLTGYIRRDAGEVDFMGRPFEVASPHEAQRNGISTIYQEINLVPLRSIAENICLGRKFSRMGMLDRRAMNAEASRLLAEFNVDVDVRRPLGEFSTATQQMTAIARAIGFSARLVIMDEPTSSLDEREVARLFQVIRKLKADGVSVVFVSHRLDEIYDICDRVTIMRDGRSTRTANLRDIGRLELVSSMLGRDVAEVQGNTTAFAARDTSRIGRVIFEARGLSAGRAVRDVSFDLRSGEIVGVAGLLGAGRTETAQLVFGAVQPTSGTMTMSGNPYRPRHAADAVAAGMGFCTEDRKTEGIVPEMSVSDNIALALLPRLSRHGVVNEQRQRELVSTLIQQLGIKCSSPGQRVRELSGGNQQKVLLARWLAICPKLLILDEPTRGIDVGAKGEIQRLIRKLADEGLSVLMISSELEELVEGASRIFVLRDGVCVDQLAGDRIDQGRILAAMAHGQPRPASVPT